MEHILQELIAPSITNGIVHQPRVKAAKLIVQLQKQIELLKTYKPHVEIDPDFELQQAKDAYREARNAEYTIQFT